jgi:oligopeptide transport system permease protein
MSEVALPSSSRSTAQECWRRLKRHRLAYASFWFIVVVVVAVIVGPWLSPYGYAQSDLSLGVAPPSFRHWLGTDELGRDILVRLLYGGRVSFSIGLSATAVSLVIGVAYGAVAGYFGRGVDSAMMRAVDILYALPTSIFVIILTVTFGRHFILLFLAIGAVEWLTMARIVRGEVQALKEREFVSAAFALGASRTRVVARHLIPNALGPVIAYATLTVPGVMLLESFLSFLGFGIQPPMSSWGTLIENGALSMEDYPWLLISPVIALSATVFALNFFGDGLRDALDPHAERR